MTGQPSISQEMVRAAAGEITSACRGGSAQGLRGARETTFSCGAGLSIMG